MKYTNKKRTKQYKINFRPIMNLLIGMGFFTVILVVAMLTASGDTKHKSSADNVNNAESNMNGLAASDNGMLAVVTKIDEESKLINLYDVNKQETVVLNYTGGTNIKDKYGKVIAISQIAIGSMVDTFYQPDKNKLTDLKISDKAWEYVGVNNLNINDVDKIMKIATTKYKYTDDLIILDGQDFIPVENLTEQDELTVRGFEETIWSITVTRGHGYVKLEDYDNFIGDNITIGYESMQQITEDMEITVREGDFNLTVENGKYSAIKNITVERNKTSYVSLSDLGPDAMRSSKVTFEISPFGADLTIDGELTSYANPIELAYGEHSITVSLGGYTSYNGKLNLDSASRNIKIELPEASSKDPALITQTDTDNDNDNGTASEITGTDNSGSNSSSEEIDTNQTGSNNTDSSPSGKDDTEDTSSGDTSDSESEDKDIVDKSHSIYVQSPKGASVYMDGDFMGISPVNFEKVVGTHVLTFIKEGYETRSYTVEVAKDGLDAYFTFPDLTLYDID